MDQSPPPAFSHAPPHDPAAPVDTEMHAPHITPIRKLMVIYIWLMVLLALTVGASFIEMGSFNIIVAMVIALIKATLVVLIFMHVLHGGRLIWIFAGSAFFWLAIMLALTFNDYATRSRLPRGQMFDADSPFVHSVPMTHVPQPKG